MSCRKKNEKEGTVATIEKTDKDLISTRNCKLFYALNAGKICFKKIGNQIVDDKPGFDVDEIANTRINLDAAKYPMEKAHGKSDKYTEL